MVPITVAARDGTKTLDHGRRGAENGRQAARRPTLPLGAAAGWAAETSRRRMAVQSLQQISACPTKGTLVRRNTHLRSPRCGLRLAPRHCTPQENANCVPGQHRPTRERPLSFLNTLHEASPRKRDSQKAVYS
eukprot:6214774-Pleurochrysis_carterae.AAC.8